MKTTLLKGMAVIISSAFIYSQASASTIHIKNNDDVDVNVVIEGGDGKLLPSKDDIKLVIKPGEEKTVEVGQKHFNSETFSITGKVAIPSLHNKCGPLLLTEEYNIIFTGGKGGGTICTYNKL